MRPWTLARAPAVSLRSFLLGWLLGGLWLLVAVVLLGHAALTGVRLARAQDDLLRQALHGVPARLSAADLPPAGALHYRVSAMGSEWLAGDRALSPCPPGMLLPQAGDAVLHVAHVNGMLVRAAAARRTWQGDGAPVPAVLQVAAPLQQRLPGWHELAAPVVLAVLAVALAMSAVIVAAVGVALRWLAQASAALATAPARPGAPAQPAAGSAGDATGPAELAALVLQMRQLHGRQQAWVEEQRRFLADASHQLRTPMAVLRTQLQSALAGDVQPQDILSQMLHTVDRAAGLATQLLSLSKLEQLKRGGELQGVDLHAAATAAVLELSPLVAAKRLDFALEGDALQVCGDAVMLGELLRNLLANAIHHTVPCGRLGILLRRCAGRAELVVWDEGPGVDDAVQPRLFQPFSAGKGGVGLGLSICRQIAEAMGATMNLYNRIEHDRVIGVDAVVAWGQGP